MFVILPVMSNLSVVVYDSNNKQTDSITARTSVLAVYFSLSNGHLIFTATATTTLEYFSILPPWNCSIYYLSTSPIETWSPTQTEGNFTIDNSQNICLFHISDNLTVVTVNYNIEKGFDSLYYQYSSASGHYTGAGIVADTSNYFTSFCWSSDATDPSKLIWIQMESLLSTLPSRRSIGSQTSFSPILLSDETMSGSPSPGSAVGDGGGMSAAVIAGIAIGCVVGVGVGVIAIGCFVIARCGSGRPLYKRSALDGAFSLQDQSDSGPLDEKGVALRRLRDRERF
jgi:hypothetical protein